MPYATSREDIPGGKLGSKGSPVKVKPVYGRNMSMMYSERPEDYHSSPHAHVAEQMNYVIEGALWVFREDEAVLVEAGDFSRVPSEMVHWSKVKEGPCVMVSCYNPPYLGSGPMVGDDLEKAVGLFGPHEDGEPANRSGNIWAAESYAENEQEMMEAYLKSQRED